MITFEHKIVTPADAALMLKHANPSNRTLARKRVKDYADAMRTGNWQDNGECIQFDDDGMLLNGHHRLNAVILANTSVPMCILRGVSATVYDIHGKRNTKNYLELEGIKANRRSVSLVKNYYYMAFGRAMPDYRALEFFEKYKSEIDEAVRISTLGKRTPQPGDIAAIYTAVFIAHRCGIEYSTLQRFMTIVNSGFFDSEHESAAIVLRNYLLENKGSYNSTESAAKTSVALRAIQDFDYGIPKRYYRKIEDTGMFKKCIEEDKAYFGW